MQKSGRGVFRQQLICTKAILYKKLILGGVHGLEPVWIVLEVST